MRFAVALLVLVFAVPLHAYGASPEVCRPYATATSQVLVTYAWLRAYSSCLNRDETPFVPTDWYNAMCVVLPDCEFAAEGSVPATDPADQPKVTPVAAPVSDSAWLAKCRRKAPASFDAKSETFIRPHTHRRVPCPH